MYLLNKLSPDWHLHYSLKLLLFFPPIQYICLIAKVLDPSLSAVMPSEGFRHLEENCPSLLSELLETIASADEKPSLMSSKKRSGSSIFGLDLAADGAAAESVHHNVRRLRRRL